MKTEARLILTRALILVALVALCAGCGAAVPTGRFDVLAAASKDVEIKTRETDADIVKLTRRFMVFTPTLKEYKLNSFEPTIEGQSFAFGPRLEPRHAALDVLASYTEALAAFARKDYQGDLDQATQSLGGSVERLAGHAAASADAKKGAGILATAVNGLGRAVIEHKRRVALREAMDAATPGIASIVNFVKDINGLAVLAVAEMRNQMLRKANRLTVADGVARLQLNEAVEGVIVESGGILAQLKQASAAVEAIGPAHAEIRNSLDRDERTQLDKLRAFVAEVKRLQGVYSSFK